MHRVEGGHGRERYWASRDEGITIADDGPGGEVAARAVGEAVDEYRMAAWHAFVARRSSEPEPWRKASLSTDLVSWLTDEELVAITQGLYDLFAPYTARDATPRCSADRSPRGAVLCLRLPRRALAPLFHRP